MSTTEFRIALALFALLLCAQILYRAPSSRELRASELAIRFGWITRLSARKRWALAVAMIGVTASALFGLIGMFFFVRASAIAFLVGTIAMEVGTRLLVKSESKSPLEWALANLTTLGAIFVLYLALLGPAKALFE